MGETLVAGLVAGGIYGILALGIVMVYRGSKVLNFAAAEVGTFALFVTWELVNRGAPWVVGAFVGLVAAGLVSAAFERVVVRGMADSPRLTVAVATIGLLLLLFSLEVKIWGTSPKTLRAPIEGQLGTVLGYVVSWTQLLALLIAAGVGLGLNAFLRRTDFGLGVLAAAQDSTAVRMMGVSLARVSQFTWVTAGLLSAAAVLLLEPTIGLFTPGIYSLGANALFVPAVVAALIGRLENLTHAFLGGLALGVVSQGVQTLFVHSTVPGVASVAIFAILIGVLVVRPRGRSLLTGDVA